MLYLLTLEQMWNILPLGLEKLGKFYMKGCHPTIVWISWSDTLIKHHLHYGSTNFNIYLVSDLV